MDEISCRGGVRPTELSEAELEGVASSMWSHDADGLVPRLVATALFWRRAYTETQESLGRAYEQLDLTQGFHRVETSHVAEVLREMAEGLGALDRKIDES
jgi:hypothetical protein